MMPILAAPWALALLGLLPLILWLHRRRQPARRIVVPSLEPWRVFAQQAAPSRRRIEGGWLLIAHLLAAAGLAIGASGLSLRRGGGPLVIVLDGSLSMGAEGRWDEAREVVVRLAVGREGAVSLVLLDAQPRVLVDRGTEASELAAALRALPAPSHPEHSRPPDLDGALRLAASLAGGGDIVVVSDGALAPPVAVGALDGAAGGVTLRRVGEKADNWGIAAVRLSRFGGVPQMFVKLAGRASGPQRRTLQVIADGRTVSEILLDLPPAGERQTLLPLVGAEAIARLTVSLSGQQDALPADDTWVMDDPLAGRPVQLAGAGARLSRAMANWPDLRPVRTGSGRLLAAESFALSIIVGDARDSGLPSGPILLVGKRASSEVAQPLVWLSTPPWLRRPVVPGLWIRPARLEGIATGLPLAKAGHQTVAALHIQDGRRIVTLAVDPEAPELAVSRSWPRLLRWAIDLAMGGGRADEGSAADSPSLDDARAEEADLYRQEAGWTLTSADEAAIAWPEPWRVAATLALAALMADAILRRRGFSGRLPRTATVASDGQGADR